MIAASDSRPGILSMLNQKSEATSFFQSCWCRAWEEGSHCPGRDWDGPRPGVSVPQPALPISQEVGGLCNIFTEVRHFLPGSYQTPLMKNSQLFFVCFHHRLVSNKRREQRGKINVVFVFLLSDFNTLDRGSNILTLCRCRAATSVSEALSWMWPIE